MSHMLPDHWEEVPLEELTTKIGSGATPKGGKKAYKEFGIPLIRSMNIHSNGFVETGLAFLDDDQAEKLKSVAVEADDVLLNITGASIGRVTTAPTDMEGARVNQHVSIIRSNGGFLPRFVSYFLASPEMQREIMDTQSGATRQALTKTKISNFQIPLPPINEQRRIADKIDALQAKSRHAREVLETVGSLLQKFRQSVLTAASNSLLLPHSDQIVTEGWSKTKLKDIVIELAQGWSPKCHNYPAQKGEWGVLKTTAIQSIDFVPEENKVLPQELTPRERLTIQRGDLLITRAGPRVRCGVTCVANSACNNLMLCDKIYRVRVDDKVANPWFISMMFNSQNYLAAIEKLKTGSSDSGMNLTQRKLLAMDIELPPLQIQDFIANKVIAILSEIKSLSSQIKQMHDSITLLDQSILAKAFRGQLVPQDPNDEPVSVFLERLKTEREEAKGKKNTRRELRVNG